MVQKKANSTSDRITTTNLGNIEYLGYPVPPPGLCYCLCGCGELMFIINEQGDERGYVRGHNSKGENHNMYGKHHSDETKRVLSLTNRGKPGPKTTFKDGHIPWNLGLKNWLSHEHLQNLSLKKGNIPWNKGKKDIMPIPWNKGKKYHTTKWIPNRKCDICKLDSKCWMHINGNPNWVCSSCYNKRYQKRYFKLNSKCIKKYKIEWYRKKHNVPPERYRV